MQASSIANIKPQKYLALANTTPAQALEGQHVAKALEKRQVRGHSRALTKDPVHDPEQESVPSARRNTSGMIVRPPMLMPRQEMLSTMQLGRIALFAPEDAGGGLERVMFQLGKGFLARGFEVDFLCFRRRKGHTLNWPPDIRVFTLDKAKGPLQRLRCRMLPVRADLRAPPPLWRSVVLGRELPQSVKRSNDLLHYLDEVRPRILLSGWPECNLVACWAKHLAPGTVKVVVGEHVVLSHVVRERVRKSRVPQFWRSLPVLVASAYRHADAIVAASNGVAGDLAQTAGIAPGRIETVYNPCIDDELLSRAGELVPHPWFRPGSPPVILGAGRLHPQKDFLTLLKAFALIRAQRRIRLMVLGEGPERQTLERFARDLGVAGDVAFPGWIPNPFAYMANAAAFVLSSSFEGFGNVVAEALACGCPVVSTDCPAGPAEILDGGKYGRLVPVGDEEKLARAIASTLANPPNRAALMTRGAAFSVDRAVEGYMDIFSRIGALRGKSEKS